MATFKFKLRKNLDNTMTIKVGRHVEHISIDGKSKAQLFDAVKWALISKGLNLPEINLTEMIYEELEKVA